VDLYLLFGGVFPCQQRRYLLRYSILFSGGTTVPGSLASTPLGGSRENINKLRIEVNPRPKSWLVQHYHCFLLSSKYSNIAYFCHQIKRLYFAQFKKPP